MMIILSHRSTITNAIKKQRNSFLYLLSSSSSSGTTSSTIHNPPAAAAVVLSPTASRRRNNKVFYHSASVPSKKCNDTTSLRTRSFFPYVRSISQQQSSSFDFEMRRIIRSRRYFYTITATNTITIIESAELAPQLQRRYKSNDAKENRQNKKQQQQEQENKQNDILQFLNLSPATKNQIQAIWTQSQSLPNQITIARILSTPLLCHFIMSNQYKLAVVGCIVAGASDVLDGYIARNYNQKTILGTYLDPLADKIFINSIALSLSYSDILPLWCTSLWLGRDVILIGMAYRMAAVASQESGNNVADPASTPLKIQPMMISKVNTLFQFGTIWTGLGCVALGYEDVFSSTMAVVVMGEQWSLSPMDGLCFVTCGTTILSGLGYMDGKSMKKRKDMKS